MSRLSSMQFDAYTYGAGETPLFGENYGKQRRGAISQSTKRLSAPPRPPRPELNPWPKDMFQTNVVQISSDMCQDDDCVEITPQYYDLAAKQLYPGRISPISPVSEETLSSAGYASSNVSPSNSLNKRFDERPVLRRRPFSFESLRSAESCYSQDDTMSQNAHQKQVIDDEDFDYADIAMANPFDFQREIDEMRPYASHTYDPEESYQPEEDEDDDDESEGEDYAVDDDVFESVETASVLSMVRPQSYIVPMSRYNSQESQQRAPPPSRRASEPEKTLDEAWADVRKAVAPKLKIAIPKMPAQRLSDRDAPTRSTSAKQVSRNVLSTEHELPPCPSPPPVPTRNPRRLTIGVSRKATVTSTPRAYRLSQSTSSPNISESFLQHSDVPPVPALPSVASRGYCPVEPLPAHCQMPMHVPAPLPATTPAASVCSADYSDSISPTDTRTSMRRAISHHTSRHQSRRPQSHQPYVSSRHSASSASLDTPPPLRISSSFKRSSMGQASSQESDQSSPRSRGFHEPPPVAPPPARFNTVHSHPTPMPRHKASQSLADVPTSPGIWTGPSKLTGATFTTEIWAGPAPKIKPATAKATPSTSKPLALRTILSSEPTTRTVYATPARAQTDASGTQSMTPSSAASDSTSHAASTATLASTITPTITPTSQAFPPSLKQHYEPPVPIRHGHSDSITALPTAPPSPPTLPPKPTTPEDAFPPLKTIPLSSKFNPTSADDYLPKFSNNFAGFCKCAWRHQTAQTNKAFGLRTVTRKTELPNATTTTTKTTTLKCKKCNFEGPLARQLTGINAASSSYASTVDLSSCAEKTPHTAHGVVYRWSFLFKSHIPAKAPLRKDENMDPHASGGDDAVKPPAQIFACLFCCAEGKGTICFEGAKMLCGHIAKCHPTGARNGGERELRMRVGIVVGRRPDKGPEADGWDIILPGNRERNERTVKNWL